MVRHPLTLDAAREGLGVEVHQVHLAVGVQERGQVEIIAVARAEDAESGPARCGTPPAPRSAATFCLCPEKPSHWSRLDALNAACLPLGSFMVTRLVEVDPIRSDGRRGPSTCLR